VKDELTDTVPPIDTGKTSKTDETYCSVGNDEFLRTVFGAAPPDARPLICSFEGNPETASRDAWFGTDWHNEADIASLAPAGANNYFSLAVFKPDDAGRFRRKKVRFHALHSVMLDDLGTKIDLGRLTLSPSWKLETSPGNHQVGYLLRVPLSDGRAADRLMNAIIAAGLCDPGANGPRARLARLPQGVNAKHAPPFPCRMVEWSPKLRYSADELVDGLQLEIASSKRSKRQRGRPIPERP
jgi:hypothetical protein